MHLFQFSGLVAFLSVTILFYALSVDPASDSAAQHVLQTAAWGLGTGTAVATVCALGAIAFQAKTEIEPGMEVAACTPYGIVSTAIATRLHIMATGGYGAEEWDYVLNAPSLGRSWALHGIDGLVQKVLG